MWDKEVTLKSIEVIPYLMPKRGTGAGRSISLHASPLQLRLAVQHSGVCTLLTAT